MEKTKAIRAHLPKRLTISFALWMLMDVNEDGAYHDLDKVVREHVERGFNCIRIESGAGITHDADGNRLPPFRIHAPFAEYSTARQIFCFGGEGECDLLQRLIELCRVCQKYGVYLILSSWYFLHTYWYCSNEQNDRIFSIPAKDMFMAFARFLHYILKELEERGLADRIAFAEIFNEVPAVPTLIGELTGEDISGIDFDKKHKEALAWLQREHPGILFAVDSDDPSAAGIDRLPSNMQVFNGHNYFLWGVYGDTLESGEPKKSEFFKGEITGEDVARSRAGRCSLSETCSPWYTRVAVCNDFDTGTAAALEEHLEKRLGTKRNEFLERLEFFCKGYERVLENHPGLPLICGEGVTYCSSQKVLWEEHSDAYWDMIRCAMNRYKEIGLWGTVIKTCCGPEDPCWYLCREKLRELNEAFLCD